MNTVPSFSRLDYPLHFHIPALEQQCKALMLPWLNAATNSTVVVIESVSSGHVV